MKRGIIALLVIVLLVGILGTTTYMARRQKHIDLDDATVGNTAGNLRGDGLFCEYNGTVYFSNAYDHGFLYSMNPDGTDIKKLNGVAAKYICAGGDYLFYYSGGSTGGHGLGYVLSRPGLYRSNLKGQKASAISDDLNTGMQLVGDYIYYQHYDNTEFSSFNKLAADKSEEIKLLEHEDIIDPACAVDGRIYYGSILKDHNLHVWDTRTDTESTVLEGSFANPTVIGDTVYFLDVNRNYRLCKESLSGGDVQVLTSERVDFYNVYGSVIFYQTSTGDNSALKRIYTDGTGEETIQDGVYNRINTTSVYTYFYAFNSDEIVYRVPTVGGSTVDTFPAAREVALAEQTKELKKKK